jgi:hypothetical protein
MAEEATTVSRAVELSSEPALVAMSDRYASRGLAKVVRENAEEQIRREEQTRAGAPDAYRLSALSEEDVDGIYRRGKDSMDTADLLRYFDETRQKRTANVDFEHDSLEDVETVVAPVVEAAVSVSISQRVQKIVPAAYQKLRENAAGWFHTGAADTFDNKRSFPLSAFAALAAIAVSLMLIVASSVMLTRAEDRVSRMTRKIDALASEVADLQADADVQNDLLVIRRIAIEEYGMVSEEYLKMDHVSMKTDDNIEVYEDEREESIGISALLSAIGIK